LKAGRIGGAALDVFETEPLTAEAGAKFAGIPNLVLTPHIAGVTEESNVRGSQVVAEKVMAELEGTACGGCGFLLRRSPRSSRTRSYAPARRSRTPPRLPARSWKRSLRDRADMVCAALRPMRPRREPARLTASQSLPLKNPAPRCLPSMPP